jgi:hypothetical protein
VYGRVGERSEVGFFFFNFFGNGGGGGRRWVGERFTIMWDMFYD